MPKTCAIDKLTDWLESLRASRTLVAPMRDADGVVAFRAVDSADDIVLDGLNTPVPPKEHVFPRSEPLFAFDHIGHNPSVTETLPTVGPWVLFGVRACDAKARLLLDALFEDSQPDPYYVARRDAATVVCIFCVEPDIECFCEAISQALTKPEGVDVMLTPLGDRFLVEALTDKGEALLAASDLLADATAADLAAREEVIRKSVSAQREAWPADELIAAARAAFEDVDLWQQVAESCIGCGICTYLCPTCSCFDVQDDSVGPQGLRYRCWDSCQFAAFCLEASGHDPRPTQAERQRQRISHKLLFSAERFGRVSCVGCGRCVKLCPVNIDIREVIERITAKQRCHSERSAAE
jgi:sulfhydrogenase subunit beta (sulfur reductase)